MLEHISQILKNKKVISKHFVCPYCKNDNAYTQFVYEVKMTKWFCPSCRSEGNLRDLVSI